MLCFVLSNMRDYLVWMIVVVEHLELWNRSLKALLIGVVSSSIGWSLKFAGYVVFVCKKDHLFFTRIFKDYILDSMSRRIYKLEWERCGYSCVGFVSLHLKLTGANSQFWLVMALNFIALKTSYIYIASHFLVIHSMLTK